MKKDSKLYKVMLGTFDSEGDRLSVESLTVVAVDAVEAIKKTKPDKGYYVQSVELIAVVDMK